MSEEFVAKDYWAMAMLAEVMKRSDRLAGDSDVPGLIIELTFIVRA